MKKNDFAKLALMGLTSSVLLLNSDGQRKLSAAELAPSSEKTASADKDSEHSNYNEDNGNIGYHLYTEEELLDELNQEGEKLYMSLNEEGKKLAREVASGRCNKTNLCKGLNACQTDKNSCAGKGSCKAQGKCGFGDKNLAVKVVADKLQKEKQ